MSQILKSKNVELTIDLPLENYNSSRFDWTGKISEVKFQDIPVSTSEKLESRNDLGKGCYNEFGIDTAVGFNEAKIGEWFHKIGVGLLKKDTGSYDFSKTYEIRPAQFKTRFENDRVVMDCRSDDNSGYSYVLRKEIRVLESGFVITYHLENTGVKKIETDEYVHNFLAINQEEIGDSYQLKFLFPLNPSLFGETVNPENKVEIGVEKIDFNDTPKQPFFFSHLNGMTSVASEWELIHVKSNIGMKEIGSFQTSKVNLWGDQHVISPELFHHISLLPGESKEWSRTYCMKRLD
jgi:hypothetical protein